MKYTKEIKLKNGLKCTLRNGTSSDAEALRESFYKTHEETDFLLTYSDEKSMSVEQEAEFLAAQEESATNIEIIALINGKIVACAGVSAVGNREKLRHRAEFGISVEKEYWHEGIGRALTEACIDCAKKAGFEQLELEAVAENEKALRLYSSVGFKEYGRYPKGFKSRYSGYQELIYMSLEL